MLKIEDEIINIIKGVNPLHFRNGKYLLYIAKIDKYYDPESFGHIETHNNKYRTVEWVSMEQLLTKQYNGAELHPRIAYTILKPRLQQLENINRSI